MGTRSLTIVYESDSKKPNTEQMKNPAPEYCPYCGERDLVEAERWFAKATDDPDNTAELTEWQCRDCHNISFWI